MTRWCYALSAALLLARAREDPNSEGRDVTETGAAEDVIGGREGGDGVPPESLPSPEDTGSRQDSGFKRPERRPVREIPPLTRPDTGRP